jgi:hypothetical protein
MPFGADHAIPRVGIRQWPWTPRGLAGSGIRALGEKMLRSAPQRRSSIPHDRSDTGMARRFVEHVVPSRGVEKRHVRVAAIRVHQDVRVEVCAIGEESLTAPSATSHWPRARPPLAIETGARAAPPAGGR